MALPIIAPVVSSPAATNSHSVAPSADVSVAQPDEPWFRDMESFLDRADATGFKVHFQLIAFEKLGNDNATLTTLASIIDRFKKHPALFAWYLADEPDGQGIDPSLLAPKYALIKQHDPSHPVSSKPFAVEPPTARQQLKQPSAR